MVVYADILFLLNAMIDYLLLLLSARAAGEPLHRLRFGIGAAIGGLYAVMMFFPRFSFLARGTYKMLIGLLMLLTAYGATGAAVKESVIFLMFTCALGGGVTAIGMMDDTALTLGRGVVYSVPDLKLILLSAAICYALLRTFVPKLFRHTAMEGELHRVCFELFDRQVEVTALTDTGNTLTDPVTGYGVPVADASALKELFPPEYRPTHDDLADPVAGIARLNVGTWSGRFRLLPYRAVGVERGLLLGVRTDCVSVGGVRREQVLVALSPTPVSDGGGYRVLMGGGT